MDNNPRNYFAISLSVRYRTSKVGIEAYNWCRKTLDTSRWYANNTGFFFKNEEDVIAFKLNFETE